jgi:hypothetical protein
MKPGVRWQVHLCCLGSLLIGSMALGQPERQPERRPREPRSAVVKPSAAKATKARGVRSPRGAKRYWADYDGNAVLRSNLDGSEVEIVTSNVQGPYGISYDQTTDSLLWTSAGDEVVQMASASDSENGTATVITLNSSFEDYFAIIINGPEHNIAYGVEGGQVVKVTQNRNTGTEQREVLLTLSSPDAVRGLALTPDHTALYLGDSVGRMSQRLNLATRQVQSLVYDNGTYSQPASGTEPVLSPVEAP